jgi:WhiB family redox-sensing transcriptional regulator
MPNHEQTTYPTAYKAPKAEVLAKARPARRVAPAADDMAWQDRGACRGYDSALFFPTEGGGRETEQAKRVCGRCPVVAECGRWALDMREPYGVWGGMTEEERRALLGLPPRNRSSRVVPAGVAA